MTVQNFFIRVIGEHRAQLLFVFRSVVGRPHAWQGDVWFQVQGVGEEAGESEICNGTGLTEITGQLLQNHLSFWTGIKMKKPKTFILINTFTMILPC